MLLCWRNEITLEGVQVDMRDLCEEGRGEGEGGGRGEGVGEIELD